LPRRREEKIKKQNAKIKITMQNPKRIQKDRLQMIDDRGWMEDE